MNEIIHTVVLILHVLGTSIIIGGLFASLLILVKEKIAQENLEYLKVLWKFLTLAIGVQIITGIYMVVVEWSEFGKNPLLWLKVGLLVVDGFFGGKTLGDRIKAITEKDRYITISNSRRLIWISLLIFVTIATLGVFLAENGSLNSSKSL
ncbi:hypothetical protein HZA76_02545 [Candidatus Roizmanbacteria bacterium]|nr:hypothetical protein [Candidatus Roizmanbacteria bacterium]